MDDITERCLVQLELEYLTLKRKLTTVEEEVASVGLASMAWSELIERQRLERIEQALKRLSNGTFGSCLRCHQSIDHERLLVIPLTELCIACQRQEELLVMDPRRKRRIQRAA
jgi:hypothetical protein